MGYAASHIVLAHVQTLCEYEALEVQIPRIKGASGKPVTPECFQGVQACKVLVQQGYFRPCKQWED